MIKRPKPFDPFMARMEAKRQVEWEARLARDAVAEKVSTSTREKLLKWAVSFWKELPGIFLSVSSVLGLVGIAYSLGY